MPRHSSCHWRVDQVTWCKHYIKKPLLGRKKLKTKFLHGVLRLNLAHCQYWRAYFDRLSLAYNIYIELSSYLEIEPTVGLLLWVRRWLCAILIIDYQGRIYFLVYKSLLIIYSNPCACTLLLYSKYIHATCWYNIRF